jgi:hypothetical protein
MSGFRASPISFAFGIKRLLRCLCGADDGQGCMASLLLKAASCHTLHQLDGLLKDAVCHEPVALKSILPVSFSGHLGVGTVAVFG